MGETGHTRLSQDKKKKKGTSHVIQIQEPKDTPSGGKRPHKQVARGQGI